MAQARTKDKQALPVVTEGSELPLSHLSTFARPDGPLKSEEELPTICGDVFNAARAQTRQLADNRPAPSRDGLLRVEAMLGVISYCYVKGIFDSGEIERRLWQDVAFLATFGNELPTAQKIRGFRRQYRATILATIERALTRFRQRATEPSSNEPAVPDRGSVTRSTLDVGDTLRLTEPRSEQVAGFMDPMRGHKTAEAFQRTAPDENQHISDTVHAKAEHLLDMASIMDHLSSDE